LIGNAPRWKQFLKKFVEEERLVTGALQLAGESIISLKMEINQPSLKDRDNVIIDMSSYNVSLSESDQILK
jgi:hypothetical protein